MNDPCSTPLMTVGDLRAFLEGLPDNQPVVVDGYEGGYETPHVEIARAVLRYRSQPGDLLGEHAEWSGDGCFDLGDFDDEVVPTNVVLISRHPTMSEK